MRRILPALLLAAGCRAAAGAPPAELGLDPFYAKYLDFGVDNPR